MFHVYILHSPEYNRYYVGHAEDLKERINRHNSGYSKSTKAYIPWILVYSESYPTKSEAQKREYEIKRKKSRKYIEWLISPAG